MRRTRAQSVPEDQQHPWVLPVNFERDLRRQRRNMSADQNTGTASTSQGPPLVIPLPNPPPRSPSVDSTDDPFALPPDGETVIPAQTSTRTQISNFDAINIIIGAMKDEDHIPFLAKYQYAYTNVRRLIPRIDDIDTSPNPRVLLQMVLGDMESLQRQIAELECAVYSLFSPIINSCPQAERSNQQVATDLITELLVSFDKLRERALRKKEYYGGGTSGSSNLKPPKLSVPKFNGNHAEWPSFKNNFTNLVRPLPDVDKLRMLVEAVKGNDAQDSVKDLALTSENWSIAWTRVTSRYDSPREIAHAALRPLLEFQAMQQQSESGLHKLIATVRTTIAQLRQIDLKKVSESDVLYLHLIMGRLDSRTIHEFTRTLTTSDVPSLDTCLNFLEKRAKDVALVREIKQNAGTTAPKPQTGTNNGNRNQKKGGRNRDQSIDPLLSMAPNQGLQQAHNDKSKKMPQQKAHPGNSNQRQQASGQQGQANGATCAFCKSNSHRSQHCPKYGTMDQPERKKAVTAAKLCFSCLSAKHITANCTSKFSCLVCNRKHHTSLHLNKPEAQPFNVLSPVAVHAESTGLVPTARITIQAGAQRARGRALLDTGASGCFITQTIASQLRLCVEDNGTEFAMANGQTIKSAGTVPLKLSEDPPGYFAIYVTAHVMPKLLSSNVPSQPFSTKTWKHLKGIQLADPGFNKPAPVDVIIGLPYLDQLMRDGRIPGKPGQATAYKTQLGYVMMGPRPDTPTIATTLQQESPPTETINFDLQRFWAVDNLPPAPSTFLTQEEQFCEDHYIANTVRLNNGRYQVRWPLLQEASMLGRSNCMAVKRWMSVETQLMKNPTRHNDYINQLQEYLDLGQMEPIPSAEFTKRPSYYIPHHAVIKESSTTTKLRIVFDASAVSSNGVSLNSLLPPGPTTQPDLFRQLLHFRENAIALKADVTKMYRQIQIHPDDQDLIRIVWRKRPSHPIGHYRLKVVPFGVTTAPFLACRTLLQLADDEMENFPEAAKILRNRFYVDDLGTSVLTDEIAQHLYWELTKLLASGGFQLRKWSTNSSPLLKVIPPDHIETSSNIDMDETATVKTLGISWTPNSDSFNFTCNPDMQRTHTKRNILSETSKVFDPLGLISPITIKAKLLMQKIWKCGVGWDDALPKEISDEWSLLSDALTSLNLKPIPRPLRLSGEGTWELHGFADASQDAYAAVIYIRSISENQIRTNLIASKTRVAPLKPLFTIPRLELQAAVLLVDLMSVIRETLTIPISRVYYWTDSAIALHWIKASPQRWKLFIRNRVSAIQEKTSAEDWAHVISADNPADCASRGLYPDELKDFSLWWSGPQWLQEKHVFQPPVPGMPQDMDLEITPSSTLAIIQPPEESLLPHLARLGSWSKIIRMLARIMVIARLRAFRAMERTPMDYTRAEDALVRLIQQEVFPELLNDPRLVYQKTPWKSMRSLKPFKDQTGLLRVGGRLHHSKLPYDGCHPIIVPNHEIIKTLIMQTHKDLFHAGKRVILNDLRQRFWLLNGTKHIKSIIDKCLVCFRYHAQPETQLMGQLPSARVSLIRPFLHTGVDFAGPYLMRNFSGRGGHFKVWICLFTCMATRAIHLELVCSLSSEGFLHAFRRFVARRGKPSHMYSDNGTNFVGANNHLSEHLDHFRQAFKHSGDCTMGLDLNKITWSFSPPLGPHHGGVWEVCVRLVKKHLRTQMKDTVYTWEQFETLLVSIEAIVNSRPLTPMDDDPESLDILTPGHFLIGTSLTTFPEADLSHLKLNRLSQYQLLTRQFQDLWKRWQKEYLQELQRTQKWSKEKPNLQVGDMVLMMDDMLPPLKWKTGRVKAVHPGADQLVRVATMEVATATNSKPNDYTVVKKEVIRPISKLARLPLASDSPSIVPGLKLLSPQTRVPVATWLSTAVILSLFRTTAAQSPLSMTIATTTTIATLALMIAVTGTLMNAFTIYHILARVLTMRKGIAYQLCTLSLCLSDFVLAAFLIPIAAVRYYFRAWMFGLTLCKISCLMLYGTVTWTLFNLIFIASLRYLKIRSLVPAPGDNPNQIVAIAVLMMCLSYLMPLLAYLDFWGTIGPKETDSTLCTILPDAAGHTPKPTIWILGVFAPFAIIYLASLIIYLRVYRLKTRFSSTPHQMKAILRLRYTMLRVLASFLLGYQPILLFNFLDNDKTLLHPGLHVASMFLAWLTTIIHPIVYWCRPRVSGLSSLSPAPRLQTSPTGPAAEKLLTRIPNPPPMPVMTRINTPVLLRRKWVHSSITVLALIALANSTQANKDLFQREPFNSELNLPVGIPAAIFELPPCESSTTPLSPVPPCISQAFWIGVLPDASICIHLKSCSNQVVGSDGSSCVPIPPICVNTTSALLDPLQCQSRNNTSQDTPPHLILKDFLPSHCSVGNLHLRNCLSIKETLQDVPVVIVKGVLYPVRDLHISEDAKLKDINAYNCSCPRAECTNGSCHGDATFCQNIGCRKSQFRDASLCYCSYVTNRPMLQVFNAPAGKLIPDCWGRLPMIVKVSSHPKHGPPTCVDCTITCLKTGIEISTPHQIPKYVKVSKNPGFVSVTPEDYDTVIPLTNHMLVSHGLITVDVWLPEADSPVIMNHTCPRLNVCEVISCHVCYDKWVNVACYDWINWGLLLLLIGFLTAIILVAKRFICLVSCIFRVLCWPCRTVWNVRKRVTSLKPQPKQPDEEQGLPLMTMGSPNPYRTTTVTRSRTQRRPGFIYKGPLLLITLLMIIHTTQHCSEFASMSASSTECRHGTGQETCHLQLNTRLAISPIGQRSCFKIANHQQVTLGTIELETKSISVLCDKQILYYVPRPTVSCQGHIQCYSLYSSSDCHDEKCHDFGINDTISALESTKDSLGWSSCIDLRYPTCPWWLTRDCHFIRTAILNPTQEAYEVFNCPEWHYAVTLNVTTRLGTNTTSEMTTLRVGERQQVTDFNLSLISVSVPPTPLLDHCFLRRKNRVALAPCNERGEDGIGRLGEIQCDSDESAQLITLSCRAQQGLITTHVDTSGIRCSSDMVDPELLLLNHALPLKLENGVLTASQGAVTFDTSQSSLLEIQLTTSNLTLTTEIQDGKCEATFIKIEGCYSCLSGAVIFIQAKTDVSESVTATLECPNGLLYTHFVVTNESSHLQQVVQVAIPEIDVTCQLKCPANIVEMHVKGHLHYLSNPNFQHHEGVLAHHAVTSGGLDFHWISIIGSSISTWFTRGFVFIGVIVFIGGILFAALKYSHMKQA